MIKIVVYQTANMTMFIMKQIFCVICWNC